MKAKSRKTFWYHNVYKIYVFLNLRSGWFGGLQPDSPTSLGAPLYQGAYRRKYDSLFLSNSSVSTMSTEKVGSNSNASDSYLRSPLFESRPAQASIMISMVSFSCFKCGDGPQIMPWLIFPTSFPIHYPIVTALYLLRFWRRRDIKHSEIN
jgi:hypothetical protein